MYNSRSACKGSVSASGLTFWPHSHTLFKEEVMFSEIWMSGCGLKQTLLSLWITIMVVVYKTRSNIHYYLRLCENDHTNKMNSYVGAESNISQKLRGLGVEKILKQYKVSLVVCNWKCRLNTHIQCWGWLGCISQCPAYEHHRHLDPPPLLAPDVWPLTPEVFAVTWIDLRQMQITQFNESSNEILLHEQHIRNNWGYIIR